MNQIKLIIYISTFFIFSCSVFVKKDEQKSEVIESNEPRLVIPANATPKRIKALEAAFDAKQGDQSVIAGAAHILVPHEHKRKTYFLYGAEHLNLENYYFDIPVVYNAAVKKWIDYFVKRGRTFFERYSARAGRYAPILGKILDDNDMPRDLIFLAMAESGFHNKAKSWARAVGPWQFMSYTGKRYGLNIDWYIDERYDPIKATISSSLYLTKLYGDFGNWELAMAGYNAGEGKIKRAIKRYGTDNFWKIRNGRYLKTETKEYVPKIMALAIIGKNLRSFNFEDIDFHEPLDFQEIEIAGGVDLITLSEDLGIDFEEIQRLNPEVLRWFSPPNLESYHLRVPVGTKQIYQDCCSQKDYTAKDFQVYTVRGANSRLRDIAGKFKIKDQSVLEWLNPSISTDKLPRNSIIRLPFRKEQDLKDNMYADLYEKPRKEVLRRKTYSSRIRLALKRGTKIRNPQGYYTVRKGDSLWTVSRKTGASLDTIICSNYHIIKERMIRAGDKLVVR